MKTENHWNLPELSENVRKYPVMSGKTKKTDDIR